MDYYVHLDCNILLVGHNYRSFLRSGYGQHLGSLPHCVGYMGQKEGLVKLISDKYCSCKKRGKEKRGLWAGY